MVDITAADRLEKGEKCERCKDEKATKFMNPSKKGYAFLCDTCDSALDGAQDIMKSHQISFRAKQDITYDSIVRISSATGITNTDIVEALVLGIIAYGPGNVYNALRDRYDSGAIRVLGNGKFTIEDIHEAIKRAVG